jgi:hypothetical protein
MVLILITFSTASLLKAKKYLLKKNNDRLTAKQAQKMLNDLDPSPKRSKIRGKPYRGC